MRRAHFAALSAMMILAGGVPLLEDAAPRRRREDGARGPGYVKFTEEELAELRTLPTKQRKRRAAELRALHRGRRNG